MTKQQIDQTVHEIGEAIRRLENGEIDPRLIVFNRRDGNYSMRIVEERDDASGYAKALR